MEFYNKKIRYLDYLERGNKIKNGGFAKVEVYGSECRIQINIRGLYPTDTLQGEIYIHSKGRELKADTIMLHFGTGTYAAKWNMADIAGCKTAYEDWDGLSIKLSEHRILQNVWKEYVPQMQDADVPQDIPAAPEEEPASEPAPQEEEKSGNSKWEPGEDATEADLQQPRQPEDAEPVPVQPLPGEERKQTEDPAEAVNIIPETKIKVAETVQASEDIVKHKTEFMQESREESGNVRPVCCKNQESADHEQPQRAGQEQIRNQQEALKHASKPLYDDKWKQLQQIYKTVHPFGDNRKYLSIAPRDFVVLPQKYQSLVSNSFLLHGYYNYGHVLLGRQEQRGESIFYLGVPGIYHEREKQVALMFGFEGFEGAAEPCTPGSFGYYMFRVEI